MRLYGYLFLFIAGYGGSIPSTSYPPGVCDFIWYTTPELGNPVYGQGTSDGVLSHQRSGLCHHVGAAPCEGFTVYPPPSQTTGRCPNGTKGSSRLDFLNRLMNCFSWSRDELWDSMLHSRCCMCPDWLLCGFIEEEGCLPRLWPSVWVRWFSRCKSRVCIFLGSVAFLLPGWMMMHIRSDDCPYDDRYDTHTTCCLPYESFHPYNHALPWDSFLPSTPDVSTNPQNLDSNLAAAVVVAPPTTPDDDQTNRVATDQLTTGQTLADLPGGGYDLPMNEDFSV